MDKIGVIHYNFPDWSLEEFFSWCRKNQISFVELQRDDIWDRKINEVEELLNRYNIKVSQISCGNDFIQKTSEECENQINLISKMCVLVKELGFNQLRIDGGWVKKTVAEKDYKSLIIKGIKRAVEIAEKEKVYLALDNHGTITNDYQFQIEIFEKIKSKYLGANLDTMNYRWYGYPVEDLLKIYKSIAPYAIHTHIKDGIGVKENYTGKIIGEGEIPVSQVIRILKENNYQGVWCIEYEGKDKDSGYKESTGKLRRLLE